MGCADSDCKSCNEECNVKQNLCKDAQGAPSYGGSFSWPTSPSGSPENANISKVWTASAWNSLKAAIDAAYAAGSLCSSAGESFGQNPMTTVSPGDIVTADIYNKAKKAINKLGGSVPGVTGGGVNGTIIRTYHASLMQSGYNGGLISTLACNKCNTACDAECDACVGCVNCEGVQHYSTCYGSCNTSGK